MRLLAVRFLIVMAMVCMAAGCANIVPPEGGKKDTTPPKLKSVSPKDSLLNTRVKKLELHFNEYVTVNNPSTEVTVSPLLPFPLTVLSYGKRVEVKIPDTALLDNTTYRISFNQSIKDLHEGNPLKPYTYTFSTGSYFDSLKLGGTVYDAATGLPDKDAVVLLYPAAQGDSAVVKGKPLYIAKPGADGTFRLEGLPGRAYRIYAIHDANNNLTYDGKKEKVAFIDSIVHPADSITAPIILKTFEEVFIDTAKPVVPVKRPFSKPGKKEEKIPFGYVLTIDTGNINKRSFDITRPLYLGFNRKIDSLNKNRIFLSYDSAGVTVESEFELKRDTNKKDTLVFTAPWKEDAVYTLRLLKGFAKDTAGMDVMPARFTFRTKNDDDYAKIEVHLPGKYRSPENILMICVDKDTVYNQPVTDTIVKLEKLRPGEYKMRIIKDKNRNGKWDTGDLFEKRQPEEVVPYLDPLQLKAGWSNIVDFETVKPGKKTGITSPGKRDKPQAK